MAEVPQMEMRARLSADTAEFTRGMQQASASMEQFAQKSNSLRGAMVGIGVASATFTTALIAFGTKSFMAAARIEELDYAMDAIGKSTKLGYQVIKDTANGIKNEGIEMEIASQAAIKFAQNHLDMSKASLLAKAAQDFAIVGAKNSTETFNMLTHAVITGRSEVLKSVGIQKSAGQMYEDYAKTLGKSAAALTYQEKQQAVLTGALKEAENVQGAYNAAMQSPGKVLRSFPRIVNNIQVALGNMLLKGIGPIVFHMYEFIKSLSKAIDESVAFQIVIEAVKQVVIKISAPFVAFFKHLKKLLDGMTRVTKAAGDVKSNFDPVGDSVKNLATKIEFLLPAVAAMLAMFATFAGAAVFANVPILGTILGGLAGPIGIVVVGLTTLYLTSTQVKDAINNLGRSMQPFLSVIAKVAKFLAMLGGYAVAILAKAISALAKVITSITEFFQKHATVAKILTGIILALVAAFLAYKAAIILLPIIQAAVTFATEAMAVAQVLMSGSQLASIASTNGLAASMLGLNAAMSANPIALIIGLIVAFIIAFGFAWKESETFRQVMTDVFNAVAKVVGAVLGFIFNLFGTLLLAFGDLMDTNQTFGKVVAAVIQFVYKALLMYVTFHVKAIKFLIDGFLDLMTTHKTFASIVENVLNFVIKAFLFYYTFFYRVVKLILDAFVYLFDTHKALGSVVAGVINFVTKAYFGLLSFILGFVKSYMDAFIDLITSHDGLRKVIESVFNVIIKIIGHAVTAIVVVLANIIKAIATLIYYFEKFKDFVAEVWSKVVAGIDKAKEFIGNIFKKIADGLSKLVAWFKDKFADMFEWLAKQAEKIPDWLGGGKVADKLNDLAESIRGVKKEDDGKGLFDFLGTLLGSAADKAIDLVTAIDKKVIAASKSWGNYEGGAAGALSSIANKMLDFALSVTEFSAKDNGAAIVAGLLKTAEVTSEGLGVIIKGLKKAGDIEFGTLLIDGLVTVAKKASEIMGKVFDVIDEQKFGTVIITGLIDTASVASKGLEIVLNALEKMAKFDLGTTIVDKTSEAAIKAGNFLIGLAAGIKSFTSENFVGKVGTSIEGLLASLKTGLGFGDILGDLAKKFSPPGVQDDDSSEKAVEAQTKRLDAVREAMKTAIESIKGVLDDLRNAAADFANSLKDTIIGFAGLKSIELPDGFIPKAKSLIENMNQRLNKSVQFASQIAQLQSMELDASALKDIIEAGPIKGAQLAASILSGDAKANISQINSLQKAIQYSGAVIGQIGADAAYGGLIKNAEEKYASLQGTLKTGGSATNQYIQQGAFQINITTKGDTDEQIEIITKKIQETFAILAKELAAK